MNIARAAAARCRDWFLVTFGSLLALLLTVGGVNVVVDPFQFFRWDGVFVTDRADLRLVTAGILRTSPPFENLVVGSSYTSNTDPQTITTLFGGRTLVAGLIGGGNIDMRLTLEFALESRPEIRRVFYESDVPYFCSSRSETSARELPVDMLRGRTLSLLPYVLSLDTIRWSLAKMGLGWSKKITTNVNDVYRWYDKRFVPFFGDAEHLQREILPAGVDTMPAQPISSGAIQSSGAQLADCFFAHEGAWPSMFPNVQFYFFNPPYFQWALWYLQKSGTASTWNRAQEIISDRLSALRNARYFDFNADTKITGDCRRYMDTAHHNLETDVEIFNLIHDGTFERTPATNSALSAAILSSAATKVPCPPAE